MQQGRAVVRFDPRALDPDEARQFAALAAQGIAEVESLLQLPSAGHRVVRLEVREDAHISAARGRTIRLPAYRVRFGSAPYLHELVHVLAPCRHAPAWFDEGLACFVECAVAERGGGYDSRLFTENGNTGVDAHAARWLNDHRGQEVLRFVGTRGMPLRIVEDRHGVAAPFYVLSHSLVKFLAEPAGVPALGRWAAALRFADAVRRDTGCAMPKLREAWIQLLHSIRGTDPRSQT